MSYCRFSSDDWKSDVYVYESCYGGFDIHVAGNRIVGDMPKADHLWISGDMEAYFKAHEIQMKFIDKAERKDIGLEYDGETFNEPTAKETIERLETLRKVGYYVPQHAIDALKEESGCEM